MLRWVRGGCRIRPQQGICRGALLSAKRLKWENANTEGETDRQLQILHKDSLIQSAVHPTNIHWSGGFSLHGVVFVTGPGNKNVSWDKCHKWGTGISVSVHIQGDLETWPQREPVGFLCLEGLDIPNLGWACGEEIYQEAMPELRLICFERHWKELGCRFIWLGYQIWHAVTGRLAEWRNPGDSSAPVSVPRTIWSPIHLSLQCLYISICKTQLRISTLLICYEN